MPTTPGLRRDRHPLHGFVDRKDNALGRSRVLGGDVVVNVAQPELRF